jgi:hypothetical protein
LPNMFFTPILRYWRLDIIGWIYKLRQEKNWTFYYF